MGVGDRGFPTTQTILMLIRVLRPFLVKTARCTSVRLIIGCTPSTARPVKVKWSYRTNDDVISSPAVARDGKTVYIPSTSGVVLASA